MIGRSKKVISRPAEKDKKIIMKKYRLKKIMKKSHNYSKKKVEKE